MAAWLSFGAQALHYYNRDHEEVRRTPLESAAAWRGPLLKEEDWLVQLTDDDVAELEAACTGIRARGMPMGDVEAHDFPLPGLEPRIAEWRRELMTGRGFLAVRGFPVERWGDETAALTYWGLGVHIGRPGGQNPAGDLLGHVLDTGEDAADPFVRRYKTAGDIAYHCDLADVVGLLCLRTAKRGGGSRIVSSVSVYNELLRRRPDLIDRLYEPFYLDTRDDSGDDRPPFFPVPPCRYAGGALKTFYHSDYFRSAQRHAALPRFTPQEQELLDLYESIANSPELYLEMQFAPGDIQLLSNHVVLHSRTAYEDHSDPRLKRHLLRLWLSIEAGA